FQHFQRLVQPCRLDVLRQSFQELVEGKAAGRLDAGTRVRALTVPSQAIRQRKSRWETCVLVEDDAVKGGSRQVGGGQGRAVQIYSTEVDAREIAISETCPREVAHSVFTAR